jgi:hypothetical protein
MAQPQARRTTTRAASVLSTATSETPLASREARIPSHYFLPPTVPSPFTGSLEASFDAILDFARIHPELRLLTTALLEDVDGSTNWPLLIQEALVKGGNGRELLEDFLFLVTRTLLPEQIAENRGLMYKMYMAKRNLAIRVTLRYDMVREWHKGDHSQNMVVESRVPHSPPLVPPAPVSNGLYPGRRAFLPNIMPTLIAATVAGGYTTKKMGDAMKHHVTGLDKWLLLKDDEVRRWDGRRLLIGVASVVLQWQWLRRNTEMLADMEVRMWESLDARADESEWVRDTRMHEQ